MCHSLKEMTPLLSAEQFFERVKPGEPFIPQDENGEPDTARVGTALSGAVVNPLRGFTSRVIVARLPWLLDKVGSKASRGIAAR
jgi:hypothetical protein